jgi:hypothetical protein
MVFHRTAVECSVKQVSAGIAARQDNLFPYNGPGSIRLTTELIGEYRNRRRREQLSQIRAAADYARAIPSVEGVPLAHCFTLPTSRVDSHMLEVIEQSPGSTPGSSQRRGQVRGLPPFPVR